MTKRTPFRAAHLDYSRASNARGELQLGGAFPADPPGAMLIFKAESADVVETFVRNDPYVLNNIVVGWTVREWTTVIGAEALTAV